MISASQRWALALGLLGLTLFIVKDALFLGGAYLGRDLLLYVPMADAFVRTVTEGALPFRDPSTGFGQPILGTPDHGVCYPPNWLNLVMLPERAYTYFVLIHYTLGATGAAALAWRVGGSVRGSFFAGAFWLVCGPLQSFLTLWHHLAGAAWMPWVLAAFDRMLQQTSRRRMLALASAFGMQILAGSADMCAMTMALAGLLLVCTSAHLPVRRVAFQFAAAMAALSIAAALGAGTWLPASEVARSSLRSSLPESVRTYWSVHPAQAVEAVMPLSLGSLSLNQDVKDALFEGREPFVKSLFMGPLVLPLFLGALVSPSIPGRYRLFAFLGTVGSAFISLGKYTLVYEALTTLVPLLTIFRFPSKAVIPLSLIAAVFAGVGVSALRGERERRASRLAMIVLIVVHAGLLLELREVVLRIVSPADSFVLPLIEEHLRAVLLLSLCALLFFGLALRGGRSRPLVLAAAASLGVTMHLNASLTPVVASAVLRFRPNHASLLRTEEPSRLYAEDYVHSRERSRRFLGRDSPFLEMKLDGMPPVAGNLFAIRQTLVSPTGGSWGLEYAWDADLRGLFNAELRSLTENSRRLEGTPTFLRMLQIANVSHVVALHTSSFADLRLVQEIEVPPLPEPLYVFEVPEALPRAYAVSGVRVLEAPVAARVVLQPDFVPTDEVILDSGTETGVSPTFESTVTIQKRRSDRVALDVTLNEAGSVVLLEGFLPGWHATVDGVSVPVRRANALFVAASVPAGRHSVVFTYRPWTAIAGVSVTVLTAIALLIGLARPRSEGVA